MEIASILAPERATCALHAGSKKRIIEMAAEHIAATMPQLEIGSVYRGLIDREKLGSTGIGEGVAIPHCRLADLESIVGGLYVFDEPVDFASPDDQPVSIVFVLLVPEEETSEHLKALAMLAERFQQAAYRESLLSAGNDAELYSRALENP